MKTYISSLKREGYLKYEYNPFHNYQTNSDLYKDSNGNVTEVNTNNLYATAGSLVDFETEQLDFDLEHPVDITVQPSYDGSVNLILNDGKNIPRLINSRFSAREKNTYEIVDRIGEYDTNIYNSENFNKDSSLYFQIEKNPIVEYNGFVKGILPVGQYCFYFTYCDADDNESDIIAESGPIPVFIGNDSDPISIDGGIKNQLSDKGVIIKLRNLDKSYNFIKVYYVRYFADYQQNRVYEAKKIYQKYPLHNLSVCYLQITGNEQAEDIDANILNITRFNPKSVLAQAQCKNMLFFGNIVKNTDNYKELTDCALRIIPTIVKEDFIDVDTNYEGNGDFGYYNSLNMYNKVGYFPGEYYRFGVVFIYANGTLSNVYNTLGGLFENSNSTLLSNCPSLYTNDDGVINRNYISVDNNGWVSLPNSSPNYLNAKGVCKIPEEYESNKILGIKFSIKSELITYLKKELGIRGLFFVRQKRIPNIIAQCYILPMDETLKAPILYTSSKSITELFIDKNKKLTQSYQDRLYTYSSDNKFDANAYAAICPDFLLNQPYYNQIFNGNKFRLKKIKENKLKSSSKEERIYTVNEGQIQLQNFSDIYICTVTEDVPTVAIQDKTYKLNIGTTEEAYRFGFAEYESTDNQNNEFNIVRGTYSPYLAIYSDGKLDVGCLYNIYSNNQQSVEQELLNRMNSYEPFYAISNRYNFENLDGTSIIISNNSESPKTLTCFRGDCYLNTFTYRLNRNFNDPSLPNNDEIIQEDTWEHYYKGLNSDNKMTEWENISCSDVNAVQLGSWITIKVRSIFNYALRSIDHSYVSEEAIMGSPRSFYPRSNLLYRGENKIPDSYLYNDAYRATLGYKCYFTINDVNYLKNVFSNRIQYSAISIQDSYKNNYRESLSTYFRDYSQEYGSIQKLVGFEGYLLVVFEHAVCIAVINERILAGQSDGEPVFINTKNVLPEELTVISDTYGTQWPESVIKSEAGYVYGVDTIQKKIWRVKNQQIEILSDFKVNKFLIDNITLGERETNPIIGLRNVKTHYNNNKKDIMFTFYDDIYKDEEKAWNLCFNEMLDQFITFYSWIPSYSENIDTQYFSFDRNTSKYLSLLKKCKNNESNKGVLVSKTVLDYPTESFTLSYKAENKRMYSIVGQDNIIEEKYANDPEQITISGFKIENDHWGFNKKLNSNNNGSILSFIDGSVFNESHPVILLEVTPYYNEQESIIYYPTETIALTTKTFLYGTNNTNPKINPFTTDFYLHGNSGIIDCQEQLYPTHWYGEFHPFEFEFAVNDRVAQQKIFTNLIIISNKAEPESFHFEIEGDNYEFSNDKRTMYFRQEATKNLYQNLGSDMLYNRKFTDVIAGKYTNEQYYRGNPKIRDYDKIPSNKENEYLDQYRKFDRVYPIDSQGLVQQVKSTIFPLYYERVDSYNEIYYIYRGMLDDTGNQVYDFKNLSGSEIIWHRRQNQFNIVTHIKNSPIDLVGRLRGNSRYKEGKWNIQIPSLIFMQKNEPNWDVQQNGINMNGDSPINKVGIKSIPPMVINSSNLPSDLTNSSISTDALPNIYKRSMSPDQQGNYSYQYLVKSVNTNNWTARKEAKLRDKWMKVRVRYSGKNLAVIHSLVTLYNISYS